ncbi:MAG: xanthine dehydrogenase family protein subunit M [Desulfobacterota bacterium]|nr:xanthine dehydrogenase family protein subunit M [Thermodesulfobacteriota bacterium]MDW8001209.1 xanthine dehydrogenase family protein subunit M [Deltaproteobacteria bacterium]
MIHDFHYLKPASLGEALSMLAEYGEACKIICGGQSLLILMRQGMVRPEYLIDIKHLKELDYITFDEKEGLSIGATTTHRTIEKSETVKKYYPVLVEMERNLASIQTRNWGTIGGNLAHADPAGDPAPVLITLGAEVTMTSVNGERKMPLEDFFVDYFTTELKENELLKEIRVPPPEPKSACVYYKFNLLKNDMAIVGVACKVTLMDDGTIKDAKICLANAGRVPIRAKKAEESVKGEKYNEKLFEKAGALASSECEPVSDIYGSEEFRRHLVAVLTRRMLASAYKAVK